MSDLAPDLASATAQARALAHALDVLSGRVSGGVSVMDMRAAWEVVDGDRQRLLVIAVWAGRLVDATDEAAAQRARRGLEKALRPR